MNNESNPNIDRAEPHENPFQSPGTSGDSRRLRALSAFWIALALAVVAGVVLLELAPGLAVLWGMLVVPGFLRAYLRLNRQRQELGRTQPAGYQLLISALSVLLVLPLLIVSLIAGGVVCTAGIFIGSYGPGGATVLLAFAGGGVALLATYIGGFIWSLRWKIPLEMKPPKDSDAP